MLRLRDNLSRSLLPVEPLDGRRVRMYSCGPTVYRYAHVGNLRTFLLADLIRRAILYHGVEVLHVQNITDVGHLRADHAGHEVDPMLVAAGLEGRSSAEIANAYEAAFHADAALMNILPAHEFPRATEHVDDMLALAERLVDLGHGYVTPLGNVYYSVASFPGYGALSGNTLDALRAGHRTEGEVESDKRDPADFALWKAAGSHRDLRWPSRWGEGFPGWHLECSAMALRHLGPTFDIHTGGEDNVFPHHEDEIAQSAPIVGGPPARLWVHGAHLLMSGRKMSKSAGNFQRITELADEGIDPLAFRYLCLTARSARKLNLSEESLAGAAAGLASLRAELAALGPAPTAGPWVPPAILRAGAAPDRPVGRAEGLAGHGDGSLADPASSGSGAPDATHSAPVIADRAAAAGVPLSVEGRILHDRFVAAIDDDLDMPAALRIARVTLRSGLPASSGLLAGSGLPTGSGRPAGSGLLADERRWLVLDMDFVLGLDLHKPVPPAAGSASARHVDTDARLGDADARLGDADRAAELPSGAQALLSERTRARSARNWAEADRLRDALRDLGLEPIDRADGSSDWRRRAT